MVQWPLQPPRWGREHRSTGNVSDPAVVPPSHDGPLGPCIELLAQRLREQQFSRTSARAQTFQSLQLSRWMRARKLGVEDLDVDAIDAHCARRPRDVRMRRGHRAALRRLLGRLREQGICPEDVAPIRLGPQQRIEADFRQFLSVERGLAPATLKNYLPVVSQRLRDRGPILLQRLRAADGIGFVQRHARDHCLRCTKLMLTAWRSFLRYLQLRGTVGADLAACVPCVPRWSLTAVPKFLPPGAGAGARGGGAAARPLRLAGRGAPPAFRRRPRGRRAPRAPCRSRRAR